VKEAGADPRTLDPRAHELFVYEDDEEPTLQRAA
jgi:hypothetical protein